MKRILVIAYHFQPQQSVGKYRTMRFLRHFRENDLSATVLTVKNPDPQFDPCTDEEVLDEYHGFPVLRVKVWPIKWLWALPTIFVKRLCRLFRIKVVVPSVASIFVFIDIYCGWIVPAYLAAKKILKANPHDLIYISAPPFSSLMIGYLLKKKIGIPLIVDYRDAWTFSAYANWRKRKYRGLEKKLLTRADALVVCSPYDMKQYRELIGYEKVHLIYNGYDVVYGGKMPEQKTAKKLVVLYLGGFAGVGRNPSTLLTALSQCDFPWKFMTLGSNNSLIHSIARKLGCDKSVETLPYVDKSQLNEYMNQAHVFFVVQGIPKGNLKNTHIASKTMDYLTTGKPILAQLPQGADHDLLEEYCANVYFVEDDSIEKMRAHLEAIWQRLEGGELMGQVSKEFLYKFNGASLTKELSDIITEKVNNSSNTAIVSE